MKDIAANPANAPYETLNRFQGATVIVTGASTGIGRATARRFALEGANVAMVARSEEDLAQAAADLPEAQVLKVVADVSKEEDAKRIAAETEAHFGSIDVLVNNAGTAVMGSIEEVDRAAWDKVIDTDLTGLYMVTRAAWPALRKSGGNVVNTSSVSGTGGDWNMFAYNAAKGGVTNLTHALALDARQSGVRVNAVNPSITRSALTGDMFDNDALMEKFMERLPLGRPGEPEDVAAAICFLASRDACFINGVNLPVDGGLSASNGQPPQA